MKERCLRHAIKRIHGRCEKYSWLVAIIMEAIVAVHKFYMSAAVRDIV